MAEVGKQIDVAMLARFEVDRDGASVRLHVRDIDGAPAVLVLPAACLSQLLMTLPRMIQEALCKGHGDDSLRMVYPIEHYRLELGELNREGIQQFILGLETGGGFSVSFAASASLMGEIARSIFRDVASHPAGEQRAATLS